ncbi:cytochrome P450 [Micrococcus luteus]|uniref:cytochrome P450 n=1 Tax=Micrococcus luteus TaxID=1270 RepID=UPI002A4FD634|nr:cytochrome P450 [Micrococcus luteus]MCV7554407.1 cytochrome P450 [Micrococcus luteus]MCV7602059.1 cytochrome P450 [Micrococcus luteus]MCV7663152.1 cytochrome P450 [Micrococcus luteus]MCV7695753.1 cytochrome P450 [Micrococcus luteus]
MTQATAGCPVHHGYEPFEMRDPFPSYSELRREEPVMYDERVGLWVVSRYDDVKAVFEDWETFSSENAQKPVRQRGPQAEQIMIEGGFTAYSGLSARVPPEHTRIRAIAQKMFTPRRYKALEPQIRENIAARLEAMAARPEKRGEMVADLAYDIPTITILTLIGADVSMVDTYKRWSDSRAAMTWSDLSDEEQIPHAHNLVEYWQECQRLVAEAHANGGDSLTADLVRAQEEGAEISDHEIASLNYSLLFAGHETTTTLIANCFRVLLSHQPAWESLVEDPKRIPAAVEEVLRYSGSIVGWRRKALKDAVVGGQHIKAGDELLLLMGSANRDEERFDRPEELDIERPNAREHLSFGFGIHFCLGNMLAKLQARLCLEEATRILPGLRLAEGADIDFRRNISFRVPVEVPVAWGD